MADLRARLARLSPEQRALLEQKLAAAPPPNEPIAIVGTACRFPQADSPEAFWNLVVGGRDATSAAPADRSFAADTGAPLPPGCYLRNVQSFDAAFFEISPREAAALDPQQRLLLEVAWEALDDAGSANRLRGSETGVFIGAHSHSDGYARLSFDDPADGGPFTATGTAHNFLSGRISYFFDFHGPSLVVDTACSSSLLAVHLACQSLRAGECQTALAGGVNLILTPHLTAAAQRMSLLAPDGRCKAFDASADGYGRGEGCGVVVLKRLSRARADDDRILAVIRGSAVNQDGRTNGVTAPNGLAQRQVLERALSNAGVSPAEVAYVEAHGTGTALGDPIEVEALATVLGRGRSADQPCWLGTAKANIGHLEGAAGIAGLIKTVLSLARQTIPPLAQFRALNPHAQTAGVLSVPSQATSWTERGGTRIAGVSSFGWSGTNVHVVVEQAPEVRSAASPQTDGQVPQALVLSARDDEALRELATQTVDLLRTNTLADVTWSRAVRRSHLERRLVLIGETSADISERAGQFLRVGEGPFIHSGVSRPEAGGLVFVFSGQGSQWAGMGQELLTRDAVVRDALAQCDEAIRRHTSWSVIDVIRDPVPSQLERIDVVQPLLFAMSVALTARWRAWGIQPDAVVGHSMGEAAAAHIAGALTLDDAARIICVRSALLRTIAGGSGMALVDMSAEEVERWIAERDEDVVVAACNSPRMTVIAGGADVIRRVTKRLTDEAVFCRVVRVDVASHSRHVDAILPALRTALAGIAPVQSRIPIYSSTRNLVVTGAELGAEYWLENLRQPVLFAGAVSQLLADGCRRFIEVSPHPILTEATEDTCVHAGIHARIVGSVERDTAEYPSLLSAMGALYADGLDVDWARVLPKGRVVDMPPYPWQRKRYWISSPAEFPRRRRQDESALGDAASTAPEASDCVFEVGWDESASSVAPAAVRGDWLVLSDDVDIGSLLSDTALSRGIRVSRAEFGPAYEESSSACFKVRAGSPDDLRRALSRCAATELVYVAARHATTAGESWTAVEPALHASVGRLLVAVQASVARGVRVWVITRNAQSVDGESVEPLSAALWGLLRVAWDEHPECAGGAIDIDSQFDAESALRAVDNIQAHRSLQVALRGNSRFVPTLRRTRVAAPPGTLDHEASYLVTGGLGGVGRILAQRLVERGARHIVLAGRQDLPARHTWNRLDQESETARRVSAVQTLEQLGAEVRVAAVDLGDEDAAHQLVDSIRISGHRLKGVVHAAATFEFMLLERLGPDDVARAARVKAGGAWHLHRAIGDAPLDFFTSCSSLASVIGLPGFAAYATANAFLDGLAHRRRAEGLAASSINWAGWRRTGRADDPRARRVVDDLDKDGFRPFSESLGAEVFDLALTHNLPQVIAADVDDASLRASRWPKAMPDLFALWHDDAEAPAGPSAPSLRNIVQAPTKDRLPQIERVLQRELGLILHLPPEDVARHAPLGTLGLESLMAVEFRRRLEHLTGLRLPATVVWSHPTVEALAIHLLNGMSAMAPPTDRDLVMASEAPALDRLSESEALATLMKGGRG